MRRVSDPALDKNLDDVPILDSSDDVTLADLIDRARASGADFGDIEEMTHAIEVLEKVNEFLAEHGLEVVIHEPTIQLEAVRWGFSIQKKKTPGR